MASKTTKQAAPWGHCALCGRAIYSAFTMTPAVCKPNGAPLYTVRAHTACAILAARKLTGAELAAARAAVAARLQSMEAFYLGLGAAVDPAGQGVTA